MASPIGIFNALRKPAAAIAAGTALSPEESEAGLLNAASKALRASSTVSRRTDADEAGIGRGQRNVLKSPQLTKKEKKAIRASIKNTEIDEAAAFNAARDWKKRHPNSDWQMPEIIGIESNDKGFLKLLTKKIPYRFNKDRNGNPIKLGSSAFNGISNNLANEIIAIAKRAEQGDPSAQKVMDNAGWYKNVESRMRSEYGSFSQMMGDILGATSPNTPVATNFKFSKDILNRFTKGDFDQQMNGFADLLDKRYAIQDKAAAYVKQQKELGRTIKEAKKDFVYIGLEGESKRISKQLQDNANTIKQTSVDPKTGELKNYGINSYNSMIALADRWRVLRPGGAPKAKNFSGNLTGRSSQATIDVWAARNLRRHAGEKPIPSSAEGTVSGNIVDTEDFRNSLEFGFGQEVIADATAKINAELGLSLEPRDVQALQWFAEKDYWTKKGWTSRQGEGGSFETMMDNDPVESLFLGLSREQSLEFQGNEFVPTPQQSQQTAQEILAAGADDPDIRASKGLPTQGAYQGTPETAMDIDIVSREDYLPVDTLDAATRQAVADQQDSFFIARRQDQLGQMNPGLFNVGTEIYFKEPVTSGSPLIKEIEGRLQSSGLPAYTMVVDPRDANKVVGMRILDVPQFSDPERFARMSAQEYDGYVREQFINYERIGQTLRSEFPQISNATPSYFDVNVKSRGASEKYLEQLSNDGVDLEKERQRFYGFKPARERFQEFAGKPGVQDLPGGTSVGPNQTGSIDPRLVGGVALGSLGAGASPQLSAQGGMGVRVPPPYPNEPQPGILGNAPSPAPTLADQGAGLLDFLANAAQGAIAPIANAPNTIIQALTSDRSNEQLKADRDQRLAQNDYQLRTDLGQQYTQNAQQTMGGLLQSLVEQAERSRIVNAAKNSRILQTIPNAYNQLPERGRIVGNALLDSFL